MQNRIDHLTRGGSDHTGRLDNRKFKWLSRTPETLQHAQVKVKCEKCLGYIRRYEEGYHIVLVSPDGVAYYEAGIDNALVSQFKESFNGKKGDYKIVWESGPWVSAPSVLPPSDHGSASLPDRDYQNIDRVNQKVKPNSEKKSKKDEDEVQHSIRRQVNPIIEDGAIRAEYAEELKKNEYTPETLKQWDEAAVKWILRHGGILGTVEAVLDGSTHKERHVSALVYRHVMNSDVFRKLPRITRVKFEIEYVFDGTAWGREGVARRIAALTLDSVEKVQALFDKLDSKLPDAERIKLWKQIKEKYGIDLTELPEHIAEDRKKLDGILRAYSAAMASTGDKIYEYWLNAILSGPQTHAANIIGNTANALYELGPKRLAEAAVNLLAKKKDAATFGEFREMWKAFDAKRAWKKALEAYDLETLNPEGKFNESANVAIDGKTGRAIRIPGRLLRAADAFSRELLIPVEAASRAYRSGKADGLNGEALARHIREELKNPASSAMRAATASATAMIFQEDPGTTVNYLIGLKNKNTILKYMLPFVRTPYNILRQGIRKSPLGALNLAKETADVLLGKRAIDSEYLGHVAEQL